jgi:hypothetical protein
MHTTNEFRTWIDLKTSGFSRSQRREYKEQLSQQLGKPFSTIERWYGGNTNPDRLQKIAVNTEMKECVFQIDEL